MANHEEWIDKYVAAIDGYFKNPSDDNAVIEYMEFIQKGANWKSKWDKLAECAGNEKYKERFDEILKEVERKLEELCL